MQLSIKPAVAASIALASLATSAVVAPAAAQTVQGIGVVNLEAVVANSTAYKNSRTEQQTTYKSQIDQANSRRQAISEQLQPLVEKLQADSQAGADQQALQQQAQQIRQMQEAGQRELEQILAPVALSQAYVEEQINEQLQVAIDGAARNQNVSLVITPDVILFADAALNMNQAVLTELDRLLPSANVVPPEGWLPRDMREQQAAAQQGQAALPTVEQATGAAQAAPSAGEQIEGR